MLAGTAIVAYCRAGFESETAADLHTCAASARLALDLPVVPNVGYVIARADGFSAPLWKSASEQTPPIFARSAFAGIGPISLLPAARGSGRADRVGPLLAAIDLLALRDGEAAPWASVWVEFPDTNDGKELSQLSRALSVRIEGELRRQSRLDATAARRLHVFLLDGGNAYIGTSDCASAAWPLGIPRLRMPGGAPSRSTLKLAEALSTFLGEREAALLRPGLRAVDLGAAPGGWTWQLAQRGLHVTAIDNGPLKGSVATNPLVTHLREDGLTWRPRRPVDWLVCDIVEQPSRIADVVARWVTDGAARRAIFNLKLPMKKRYDEVRRCAARIDEIMSGSHLRHTLQIRQLYHDREEVTAYLARVA